MYSYTYIERRRVETLIRTYDGGSVIGDIELTGPAWEVCKCISPSTKNIHYHEVCTYKKYTLPEVCIYKNICIYL